jgi:hypothetical protein
MNNIKTDFYVLTHKKINELKLSDYSILQVGKFFTDEVHADLNDYTGDNISIKNKNYSELTGQYWVWKNKLGSNNVGFVHYRRFFSKSHFSINKKYYLTSKLASKIFLKYDIILPKKLYFWNFNVAKTYENGNGYEKDLILTRKSIELLYPSYIETFDSFLKTHNGFYFNMFVTKSDIYNDYMTWLFEILFHLESNLSIESYNVQEARVFGYISELLLNVYVQKNKLKIKEYPVIFVEESIFSRHLSIIKFYVKKILMTLLGK